MKQDPAESFWKGVMKKLTRNFVQFYKLTSSKLQESVTRVEM